MARRQQTGRVRCELCVTAISDATALSKFYSENAAIEHLSLQMSVPCPRTDDARWRAAHWGTAEDVTDVQYRADSKQRFYSFVSVVSPPLKWQRVVAAKYPDLHFVLSYESADSEFSGYVSYAEGRPVGQFGGEFCLRRSLAHVLSQYDREQRALTVLRPLLTFYVQDRLYRHPDGLRLPALRCDFQSRVAAA